MARTRQLHPEFFKHEDLGALSPLHRLLFQGMWCEADREGRLEDRPKRLRATWLPYDDADGDKLVDDLAAGGHVVRYQVGALRLLVIPSFKRWQKVHPSEVESKLPGPPADSGRSENSLHQEVGPTPGGLRNPPLSSLPSQSSLPSCNSSSRSRARQQQQRPLPSPDERVTGKELRERWNQVAAPPSRLARWDVMPPAQEMQADAVALDFDRATWDRFFAILRRSAFLNGMGPKGWKLSAGVLLKNARHYVTQALNGEYDGDGDLPEEPAPQPGSAPACANCGARAVNPGALPEKLRCGACTVAEMAVPRA